MVFRVDFSDRCGDYPQVITAVLAAKEVCLGAFILVAAYPIPRG
jgi:hypothetical protein